MKLKLHRGDVWLLFCQTFQYGGVCGTPGFPNVPLTSPCLLCLSNFALTPTFDVLLWVVVQDDGRTPDLTLGHSVSRHLGLL
jgi:hypothetical protein